MEQCEDAGRQEPAILPTTSAAVRSQLGSWWLVPLVALVSIALLVVMVGAAFSGLSSVQRSDGLARRLERALSLHQDGDMMHDALRADVLNALVIGAVPRGEEVDSAAEVARDTAANADQFRDDLTGVASYELDGAAGATVRDVVPALTAFIDDALAIVDLARRDRAAAVGRLQGFDREFERVEAAEAAITKQLSAALTDALRSSTGARRRARAQLVLAGGFVLSALIGAAYAIDRGRRRHARSWVALQDARRTALEEREFLSAVLESLEDGIVACDSHGALTIFNTATERFHGLPVEDLPPDLWAEHFDLFRADGVTPLPTEEIPLVRALQGDTIDGTAMVIAPRHGKTRLVHATGRAIFGPGGAKLGAVIAMHDVTEQTAAEERLVRQASEDALTGLPNRLVLADRLEQASGRAERETSTVCLLFLDLDDFKTVNDGLGHAAGDEVLIEVAHRLRRAVRSGDTVVRLGGDEFAVLLESLDHEVTVARLLRAVRTPIPLSAGSVRLTASVGVAQTGVGGVQVNELLQAADLAMYVAKANGKDRFEVFVPAMQAAVQLRHELGAELRDAIKRDDLRVHYQPQVDLVTGRVVAVEALVRWQHPVRGLVPPDYFIPLAETTGQIVEIDDWVLRTACSELLRWPATEVPLRLAVNLSGRNFQHPGVVERITAALVDTGFDPRRLEVEITESAVVHEAATAAGELARLRAMGIRIAIDDFGTGYSVLSRLRDFPLDVVKIDRSFIREIDTVSAHAPIVSAMIAMAQGLGVEIVAEGIETIEQQRWLRSHGCDIGQGYLLGRPAAAADIAAIIGMPVSVDDGASDAAPFVRPPLSEHRTMEEVTRPFLTELERLTGLESVYLTEIHWDTEQQEVRFARNVGDLAIPEGLTVGWSDTLCRRVLLGGPRATSEVPSVFPDSHTAQDLGLQSYVSVPVFFENGEIYGTLCGASAGRRELDETGLRVMELFAERIADSIGTLEAEGGGRAADGAAQGG